MVDQNPTSSSEEKIGVEKNNWRKFEADAYACGYNPSDEKSMQEYLNSEDYQTFLDKELK